MQSNFYNVVIFENLLFLESKSIENNKSVNSINFNVIKWLLPNCYIALVWKLIVCKYWYHHFNEWSLFVLEQDVREQIYDDSEYDIPITNTILFNKLFKTTFIRVIFYIIPWYIKSLLLGILPMFLFYNERFPGITRVYCHGWLINIEF